MSLDSYLKSVRPYMILVLVLVVSAGNLALANETILEKNDASVFRRMNSKGQTEVKLEGDRMQVAKSDTQINWNGALHRVDVRQYQNMPIAVRFEANVKDVKIYGNKSFHGFSFLLEFIDEQSTNVIGRENVTFRKQTDGWETTNLNITIPAKARWMDVKFVFGFATGLAEVRQLQIKQNIFKVVNQSSSDFKTALIVQKKNAAAAEQSQLALKDAGKLIATNKVLFDNDGLYFHIQVNDDSFFQVYKGMNTWKGDSLQMAFDPLCDRTAKPGDEDYEFCFAFADNQAEITPILIKKETVFTQQDVKFDFSHTTGKQSYDIHLPWQVLDIHDTDKIEKMGYAYAINDNDGKGRTGYEWASGIIDGKSPQKYGILIFDKQDLGIGAAAILDHQDQQFYDDDQVHLILLVPAVTKAITEAQYTIRINKKKVYANTLNLIQGENRLRVSFPASLLEYGLNDLNVGISAADHPLLNQIFQITRTSLEQVKSDINRLQQNNLKQIDSLQKVLGNLPSDQLNTKRAQSSLGVGQIFHELIASDLSQERYNLALRQAHQINEILNKALNSVKTEQDQQVVRPVHMPIKPADGWFRDAQGMPVFLFGSYGIEDIKSVKSLNFNTKRIAWPSIHHFFKSDALIPSSSVDNVLGIYVNSIRKAFQNQLVTWTDPLNVIEKRVPKYFKKQYPEAFVSGNHFLDLDPDHPKFIEAWDAYVGLVAKAIHQSGLSDNIIAIDLQREPGFSSVTPYTEAKYRDYLKDKYHQIDLLNQSWGTDFKSFEKVGNPNSYFLIPNAFYDWCQFNNQRLMLHFKRMKSQFTDAFKGDAIPPISMTLMNGIHWRDKSYYSTGYDRELLMKITDVNGCDTRIYPEADEHFSLDWQNQSMSFDFQKALDPKQPIFDSEWHSVQSVGHVHPVVDAKYLKCALRLATWHGLAGCHLWSYTGDRDQKDPIYLIGNAMTFPLVLEAYTHESLKINQNFDRVTSFAKSHKPIAIYYSLPSAVYDGIAYLEVLKKVYRALYFQDVSVTFVTDQMLENDVINQRQIELLVIPNARYADAKAIAKIKQIQQKIPVVFVGKDCLSQTPAGSGGNLTPFAPSIQWPIHSNWLDYIEPATKVLEQAKITRAFGLSIQDTEAKIKTIEARFARFENKNIGYAVNLGKSAVTFSITNQSSRQTVDVLDVDTKQLMREITLQPYEFISFDIVDK